MPKLQQFGVPEEGWNQVPSTWLLLRVRGHFSPFPDRLLQVLSAVVETSPPFTVTP